MTTSTDVQILLVILDEVKAIRQDNADFKAEIKQDMQNFKDEIRSDMQNFKDELRSDIQSFKEEMHSDMQNFKTEIKQELSGIHAEIGQLQKDTIRMQSDMNWLLHIDYWLITVIVAIFVLPHVLNSVTAIFKAIVEGRREIARIFTKGGTENN